MTSSYGRAWLSGVLLCAAIGGCGGGTTGELDGGTDAPREDTSGELDAPVDAPIDVFVAVDAGPPAHCGNGSTDGDETDLDCGGSCARCANGSACEAASDCASTRCLVQRCAADVFAPLADLPTGRGYLAATLGPDGRIYTFGGIAPGVSRANRVVEIYDPEMDAWTSGADIPTPRYGAVAVTGSDGRIYLMGGEYDGETFTRGHSDVVESYDPVTDTWRTEPSLPLGRTYAAGVSFRGRITVVGGFDVETRTRDDEVYTFAPGESAWRIETRRLTVPRSGAGAAADGDATIVVVGGSDDAATETFDGTAWFTRAPMLTSRGLVAAAVSDHRVYAFGGGHVSVGTVVEGYDIASNTWFVARSLTVGRLAPAAVTLEDGSIVVLGGITGVVAEGSRSVVRYTP